MWRNTVWGRAEPDNNNARRCGSESLADDRQEWNTCFSGTT